MQTETNKRLSPNEVTDKLRSEANKDPVFSAVAHVFAMRERARQQVTVRNLAFTMHKEGFKFNKEQLQRVLKFLAGLHLGRLETTSKGEITALKDIRITLQSIGLAAVAKQDSLERLKTHNSFSRLPNTPASSKDEAPSIPPKPHAKTPTLVVKMNGDSLTFDLPKNVTMKDLMALVARMYSRKTEVSQ